MSEVAVSAFLFVTDLDNTLVGDDEALKELNQQLAQHRQEYGTKIVYATGRSRSIYHDLKAEKQLLDPDALIAAVGTEFMMMIAKMLPIQLGRKNFLKAGTAN
jgi:hydroxymethylpyrimidine pyrophosphatase-like HAD family hydrolase